MSLNFCCESGIESTYAPFSLYLLLKTYNKLQSRLAVLSVFPLVIQNATYFTDDLLERLRGLTVLHVPFNCCVLFVAQIRQLDQGD